MTDRARATYLFALYSVEITEVIDGVVGAGSSSNHEVQVLTHLFNAGPTNRRGLRELTGLSRNGIAQLVGRLDELGLVSSTHGLDDKRVVLCALTRSGRRRIRELGTTLEEFFESSAPFVTEIVELLTGERAVVREHQRGTPLEIAGLMGGAGASLSRRLDEELGVNGLRPRLALATLAVWGTARPVQLADLLGVSSGGLTYIIDQLESDGLVQRTYGDVAHDRRAVVIALTPAGRASAQIMADLLHDHADDLAGALAETLAHPTSRTG
jgi:DNA-binding MarR family transcriptional regulator